MSTRTFRITVRGAFQGLSAEQKSELAAEAAEHDILDATYTPEGKLTYDLGFGPAFNFRYLDSGEAEEDILLAAERAQESAKAWLDGRGYGYTNLRSKAEDMSQAPLSKRQRRAAAAQQAD